MCCYKLKKQGFLFNIGLLHICAINKQIFSFVSLFFIKKMPRSN